METNHVSNAAPIDFSAIETLVHQGKTVVSSEDSAIVRSALKTIAEGRTATFYLKPSVFGAIIRRYWTPELAKAVGLQPISGVQAAKIKSDLNIEVDGYANSLTCPRCEHVYSTYEFIQQGFKEHGEEAVRTAFSLKRVGILQINPLQHPMCPECRLDISLAVGERYSPTYHYAYNDPKTGRPEYACCQLLDEPILTARAREWSRG